MKALPERLLANPTSDIMREAASSLIWKENQNKLLRTALRAAERTIEAHRRSLFEAHAVNGSIPDIDFDGLSGLAEYDAVLAKIRSALSRPQEKKNNAK